MKVNRIVPLLLLVVIAATTLSACITDDHCPDVTPPAWWGGSSGQGVTYTSARGATSATVFKPVDTVTYPGARPAIIVLHGVGEDECHQRWSAQALAGHGYVTLAFTNPSGTPDIPGAINFLLSANDPFVDSVQPSQIGLLGHSNGGRYAERDQQTDARVKAFIYYDNLKADLSTDDGDPSSPGPNCGPALVDPVVPKVPSLGIASDFGCDGNPTFTPPDLKLSGFNWWQSHGLSSGELVIAGAHHLDFETSGPDQVHENVFYATQAWFDYWLLGDPSGMARLAAPTWNGTQRGSILSSRFISAIATPGYMCTDLATC